MYEANVDDVGYRLVAVYTPVRDDGAEGQPVSASTDPIAVGNYILLSRLLLLVEILRESILPKYFTLPSIFYAVNISYSQGIMISNPKQSF